MTYCPTPRAACSATRSSMKRARATMEARKGRVNGLMSGRLRHPSSGAANFKPTSSSSTCGGESTSTCSARHKATRTAVLSGAATCLSCMTESLRTSRNSLTPTAEKSLHHEYALRLEVQQPSQLTAFFTSAPILASSAAVNSFSAKATGHTVSSSRFALSLKPNVAYLALNLCALWKKQTTLPSLAYAGIPYQVLGERAGA